jgi:hypothetical protein
MNQIWQKAPLFLVAGLLALLPSPGAAFCSYFSFELHPEQVVPQSDGLGFGASELSLCEDLILSGYVYVDVSETVTGVHIHGPADAGEWGEILYSLPLPVSGMSPVSVGPVSAAEKDWFELGMMYVDVHSDVHPDGVIRGQVYGEIAVEKSPWSAVKRLFRQGPEDTGQ